MSEQSIYLAGHGVLKPSAEGDWQPVAGEPTADMIAVPGIVDLAVSPQQGRALTSWLEKEEPFLHQGGLVTALLEGLDIAHSADLLKHGFEANGRRGPWRAVPRLTEQGRWESLADLSALRDAGHVMLDAGQKLPSEQLDRLHRSLQLCAQLDIRMAIVPRFTSLAGGLAVHAGAMAERYGLEGEPALAETTAVALLIEIARETGCAIHLKRLSCARSVDLLAQARSEGLDISADVAIANLCFSELDLGALDNRFLAQPPLRSQNDREALLRGVAEGTIDAVVSHHRSPVTADALIEGTQPGHRAMHLLAPLMFHLAEQGAFSLQRAIDCISTAPARLAGISLTKAQPGDAFSCVLFERRAEGYIETNANSPWCGWPLNYGRD
jgi:dihydroorotase